MSLLKNQLFLSWRDKNGRPATTYWVTLDQDAGAAAAFAALAAGTQALSDAAIEAVQFQQTLILGNTPLDGPYCTVDDHVTFQFPFVGQRGGTSLGVPAPKSSILQANLIEVDLTNPDVVAWAELMATFVGSSAGNPVAFPKRGLRFGRP